MTEPAVPSSPSVLQLRVVLREISPLVWRRLLVSSESTIADLHDVLQASFGWSDDHLHRFEVHGHEYGISSLGGISFRDDAREVRLGSLGLRIGERFVYEYDFGDGWLHDLRVEQIVGSEAGRTCPRCSGGRRAGPPEDCGGPWAFQAWRQDHRRHEVTSRLLEAPRRRRRRALRQRLGVRGPVPVDGPRRLRPTALNRRLATLAERSAS